MGKNFLLYAIAFILYALTAANYIHAASRFLSDLGPEFLPYQFVVVALLIIAHSLLSAFVSMRMKSSKIFGGTLLFFLLNYVVLLAVPLGTFGHSFYFLVIANFMLFLEELTIIHFLNSLMTPLQAKRNLPIIFGFTHLGVIVGSFFAPKYAMFHETWGIGTVPIVVLGVMIGIVVVASQLFRREIAAHFANIEKAPFWANIQKAGRYVRRESPLYAWLALIIVLAVGLQLSVEFKLKTVVAFTFSHEQIAEVLGLVFAAKSVVLWLFTSFGMKRLLFRLGVGNMLLLYPISMIVAIVVALAFQLHYLAVFGLFIVFALSHFGSYGITTSQILSIAPKHLQHSVYFLLRGIVYALALLVFSLSLLLYSYNINLEPTVNSAVIVGISLLFLYAALQVRQLYFKNLKRNLYKADPYLKLRSIDLLAEKVSIGRGEDDLRRILNMQQLDKEVQSRVITSLGVIGNYQTVVDLTKILCSDEPPKTKLEAIHAITAIVQDGADLNRYPVTKHYLLRAYEELLLSEAPHSLKSEVIRALQYFDLEDVVQFLEDHLKSDNSHMIANTIKTFGEFGDRGIIPYLEPFLESDKVGLVSEAIVALWQFEEMRVHLLPRLAGLLGLKKKVCVRNALYVIGSIKASWEKDYVLEQLDHRDSHIKNYAMITLIRLGDSEQIENLVKKMLELAKRNERDELEFLFSWYRLLDDDVKKKIIMDIQQLKERDAQYFLEAFRDSRFVFSNEVMALS